jgi:hypothetical protein
MVLFGTFELALIVLLIVAGWKIFEKAGQPGWAAIIPIYNIIVMLKIVGKPLWWLIMFIIPGVNLVFAIWTLNMLSKSFGKDEGFTVGLLLLGIVFYPGFRRRPLSRPLRRPRGFPGSPEPPVRFRKRFSTGIILT